MPDIMDWRSGHPQELLALTIQRLWEGQLVAFPTDTSYIVAASAVRPDAVSRLAEMTAGIGKDGFTLAVRGLGEGLDWIPEMSVIGRRLAARCWPGPLTLAFAAEPGQGVGAQLPEDVAAALGGKLLLRCPSHQAIYNVLLHFPGPVIFRNLCQDDGTEITSAEAAQQNAAFDLLLIDGDTYFAAPASVVEVNGTRWKLLREGVVSADDLEQLAACRIVFVCTGNTCRSPMAEALCKKLLAEHLQCAPEELPAKGYQVQSAGLSASPSGSAAQEALATAQEMGADLSAHQTQPLTAELLAHADFVLTMTHSHLQALSGHGMNRITFPQLLSCDGEDISDPIGAEREVYQQCAQEILKHLQRRLPEFLQI